MPSPDTSQELAQDLVSLAAERSSAKRLELLRRVADVFAARSNPAMAENYLFNEVVSKLVDKITGSDRATASRTLAAMTNLPEGLVRRLAADTDIEVARPVIGGRKAVPERVLVEVARTGSQEHLRLIAARADVTEPVSEVVAERGDASVVRILARNSGARFCDAGMSRMIDKAAHDSGLQALLVDREDLSLAAVERLMPMVNAELARRLRDKAAVDDMVVKDHVAGWLADRKKNAARTEAFIAGIRKGDLNAADAFRELLPQGRLYDAAAVLAAMLALDRDYTFGVLAGCSLQSALLLMRAATLPWSVVEAFLTLRESKAAQYQYQTLPSRAEYLALDAGAAQRVLRFANVRRSAGATAL